MIQIEIPGLVPTLNQIYQSIHWAKRKKMVDEWHEIMLWEFKRQNVPRPLKWPFTLSITQFSKRIPRDTDGTILGAKFALDALVEFGYIPDDSPEYVPTVILNSRKGKENKLIIQIQN